MSVENLSAVGIVTAAVLYMLAFLAHAVEWASVRGTEHPSHEERLRSETWGRMGLNLTVLGAVLPFVVLVLVLGVPVWLVVRRRQVLPPPAQA